MIRVFTDGACSENPGPGGWGAVFLLSDNFKTLRGHELNTTNNRMELRAVIESLKKISNAKSEAEFELYSDSAYVVNAINNNWIQKWKVNDWKTAKGGDVKNKEMWEEFLNVVEDVKSKGIKFKIIKVKGHAGDTFNELVDKIAKLESSVARNLSES